MLHNCLLIVGRKGLIAPCPSSSWLFGNIFQVTGAGALTTTTGVRIGFIRSQTIAMYPGVCQ